MSKDNSIWDEVLLPAQMPKDEYDRFIHHVNRCNERLIESARKFDSDVRDQVCLSVDFKRLGLKPQKEYKVEYQNAYNKAFWYSLAI